MKIISTSLHSKLDYLTSILFIAMPWILKFNDVVPATWTLIVIGSMAILMSLFTDYEGGIVRSIPMSVHLNVDILSGLFLAASPWILGFANEVFLPQLILGLFEVAAGLMTVRTVHSEQESGLERSHQP